MCSSTRTRRTARAPRSLRARVIAGDMDDWGLQLHVRSELPLRAGRRQRRAARRHRRRLHRRRPGPDTMFGDTGADITTYAGRPAGVTVTLDNNANDGSLGEQDNVSSTIENVTGTGVQRRPRRQRVANLLDGGGGNDRADRPGRRRHVPDPGARRRRRLQRRHRHRPRHLRGAPAAGRRPDRRRPQRRRPAAAEGDNVRLDVENVTGGSGDDVLVRQPVRQPAGRRAGQRRARRPRRRRHAVGAWASTGCSAASATTSCDGVDGIAANDVLNGQVDSDTCTSDAGDTEIDCEL